MNTRCENRAIRKNKEHATHPKGPRHAQHTLAAKSHPARSQLPRGPL